MLELIGDQGVAVRYFGVGDDGKMTEGHRRRVEAHSPRVEGGVQSDPAGRFSLHPSLHTQDSLRPSVGIVGGTLLISVRGNIN